MFSTVTRPFPTTSLSSEAADAGKTISFIPDTQRLAAATVRNCPPPFVICTETSASEPPLSINRTPRTTPFAAPRLLRRNSPADYF